jgi:endonuclease G, mitochondrial
MKKITFLLVFISMFGYAQDSYKHSINGEYVAHSRYSLSYLEKHEQAEWVCYSLNYNLLRGNTERSNNFRVDSSISTRSASLNDYKGTGYDRGHLVPAGDMKDSYRSMSESFFMSNMSPQDPSFNRGGWKRLESLVRSWAEKNELYIVTAGVLKESLPKIGTNGVSIPKYFYKIIYAPSSSKMIGFLMPNTKINLDLSDYVKTVDEIEKLTNIDFFYNIDDDLENRLESELRIDNWDFSSTPSFSTSSSNSTSVQCKGIAKSTGQRCRNKSKNTNGYCYVHRAQAPDYIPPKKSNYIGRCNATTKKGSRCKRNASGGSRYCWQHP